MSKRLQDLYNLPSSDTFRLRLPGKASCLEWESKDVTIENLRGVNIYDLFHDRFLYEEFLNYSKSIYSEENVYLARAISIFKCLFAHSNSTGIPPEAEDQAWLIFRFFIAPGSAYEVSGLSYLRRKQITLKLAHPEPDMFKALEKSIYRLVRDQYLTFSSTKSFREIPDKILKQKAKIQSNDEMHCMHDSCFFGYSSSKFVKPPLMQSAKTMKISFSHISTK
jgi:hypothetical protein